ncbi:MAG: CPBP family glutamic-type intramembrane protease [Planctomycetia bacterium]|nr:CPBP family glutamic-type intramembrane protease [Planctomycetia bacterium]
MPADVWTEAIRMTTSGLLVASVALPIGLLALALRPKTEPLLPRWKPWRVPWNGYAVLIAFIVVAGVLPPLVHNALINAGFFQHVYGPDFPTPKAEGVDETQAKVAATLRVLWMRLFALPLQLGALWLAVRVFYPKWRRPTDGSWGNSVALAVLAWLVLTPIVLLVNAGVGQLYEHFHGKRIGHDLTQLAGAPLRDQVLLVIGACVLAPLVEEILFRGMLLPWCIGRLKFPGAGVAPVTTARPWFVMFAAVVFAAASKKPGATVFVGVLVFGLVAVWGFVRTGARRTRAIYATAAFFAVIHSATWPDPVPLFLLGLGLGWLAVRTRGVLVPIIVHGLFNAVSAVSVLRSA